jgi:prevent-host-death family protein
LYVLYRFKPGKETMATLDAAEARDKFADTINRAAYGKERVIVKRRGKPIAAVIPIQDLELLEQLEDAIDLEEARRILADPHETAQSWDSVKKELGL